jgi:hypothetical protein
MGEYAEQAQRPLLPHDAHPESAPELPREITILKGAVSSVDKRVRELIDRLEPVLRPTEPTAEVAAKLGSDSLPVSTRYAVELRDIQHELSRLEDVVSYVLHRLEI